MMNKLIRPCTLWDETFDALCVNDIIRDDKLKNRKKFDFNVALYFLGNHFIIYSPYVQTRKEQDALFQEAITAIYNALNALVLATEEVLDAMNKVPEAQFWHVEGSVNTRLKWNDALKTFTVNGQTLSITDYIQADCPLALEALLKFYTDGTSIKGKETE